MPATDWGWLITADELQSWILLDSPEVFSVNKPPHVVCHPSRYGPWSSLIGAAREYLGLERLHMPFRLDRETSGVLLFGKTREAGQRLQHAVLASRVRKEYLAIVEGRLDAPLTIDAPIGPDEHSEFFRRQTTRPDGQSALTVAEPVAHAPGHTLVRAFPKTGRRHQIRVHLASAGLPIVGDKLYGPDPGLMLRFMQANFAESLISELPIRRHALHCAQVTFSTALGEESWAAPMPDDMGSLWARLTGSAAISS